MLFDQLVLVVFLNGGPWNIGDGGAFAVAVAESGSPEDVAACRERLGIHPPFEEYRRFSVMTLVPNADQIFQNTQTVAGIETMLKLLLDMGAAAGKSRGIGECSGLANIAFNR